MAGSETDVVRVLFRTIDEGDLRKMDAVSNDAPTGGGARDLRFSPVRQILAVLPANVSRSCAEKATVETD